MRHVPFRVNVVSLLREIAAWRMKDESRELMT